MMKPRMCLPFISLWPLQLEKELTGLIIIPECVLSSRSYSTSLPERSLKKLCGEWNRKWVRLYNLVHRWHNSSLFLLFEKEGTKEKTCRGVEKCKVEILMLQYNFPWVFSLGIRKLREDMLVFLKYLKSCHVEEGVDFCLRPRGHN